ncbi:hypothetical protein OKW43_008447 [Paraburkholderia sp. WC7.3g]
MKGVVDLMARRVTGEQVAALRGELGGTLRIGARLDS